MNPISSSTKPSGLGDIMALREQILQRNEALQQVSASRTEAAGSAPIAAAQQAEANGPLGSFADTLSNAIGNVNAIQQHSGAMTAAYERGEVTDIAQVMIARQESSVAFEATMQVRNKLLSAYQEIMRMGG